jgi:hypothetical protein
VKGWPRMALAAGSYTACSTKLPFSTRRFWGRSVYHCRSLLPQPPRPYWQPFAIWASHLEERSAVPPNSSLQRKLHLNGASSGGGL